MKNYKLTIQYDGAGFYGYQKLPDHRTVQGELEKAIFKITDEKVQVHCAWRTDRWVHALGQVVSFQISQNIPFENIKLALNNILPQDIRIIDIELVNDDFHARFHAKSRSYIYVIKHMKHYSVFEKNYITFIENDIDIDKANQLLASFLWTHDFDSFRSANCGADSPIRTIKSISLKKDQDKYILHISADWFLKNMVRIIVGAVLYELSWKNKSWTISAKLENSKAVNPHKYVAPASGLYLEGVGY